MFIFGLLNDRMFQFQARAVDFKTKLFLHGFTSGAGNIKPLPKIYVLFARVKEYSLCSKENSVRGTYFSFAATFIYTILGWPNEIFPLIQR